MTGESANLFFGPVGTVVVASAAVALAGDGHFQPLAGASNHHQGARFARIRVYGSADQLLDLAATHRLCSVRYWRFVLLRTTTSAIKPAHSTCCTEEHRGVPGTQVGYSSGLGRSPLMLEQTTLALLHACEPLGKRRRTAAPK